MSSLNLFTRFHRPLVWFAASMGVLALVSAVGIFVDDRVLVGVPIWTKPFKFSVSFVAYALSLAWMLSLLPRGRRVGWWAGTVVAAASAGEMVLITLQVIRGTQSHFNQATPFDDAVFQLMGATVVVLWLGALVIAVLLLRAKILDRAMAWAVRLSSLIALAGAAVGFLMVRPKPEQLAVDHPPIDDGPMTEGLIEVGRWLEEFHPRALVELDFGGLVHAVTEEWLAEDRSAAQLAEGLAALRAGDGERASDTYGRLAERWRTVRDLRFAN